MSRNILTFKNITLALAVAAFTAMTTGCAMDPITLSGVEPTPVTVHATISGIVHGGQNPVSGSSITMATLGTTGYGSTATQLINAGTIGSISLTSGGSGYVVAPSVSFTGGGGSGATAVATLGSGATAGQVVSLTLTSSGSGYTSTPTVVFTGASTTSATATAVAVPTSGIVSGSNGNFTITGDFTCPSSTSLVVIAATGGNPGVGGSNNSAIVLLAPLGQCGSLSSSTTVVINEVTTAALAFALAQYASLSTGSIGAPSTTQGQIGYTNAYNTIYNLVNPTTGVAVTTNTITNSFGSVTITPDSAKLNTIADVLAACVNSTGPSSSACTTLFSDVTPTGGTAPPNTLDAAFYMALNPTSTNSNTSLSNITALYGLASGYPQFPGLGTQPTDWTIGISYGLAAVGTGFNPLDEPEWFAFDASGNLWILNYGTSNLSELSPTGAPLYSGGTTVIGASTPYSVIVDPSGNIWATNAYAATGNIGSSAPKQVVEYSGGTYTTVTTTNAPYALASDGKGDIFVLEGAANTVEEITSGASTVTAVNSTGLTLTKYSTIAVDSNYNLWITSGASNTSIYEIPYSSGSYGAPVASTNTNLVEGEPLAIDGSNNIWVGNYSTTVPSVAKIPAATPTGGPQYAVTGATGSIEGVAIDGGGNAWISNYSTSTNGFYEVSSSGTELSTSAGYAHTTHDGKAIAVDPSGNVWIGGTGTNTSSTALVELVGAAVPVITPIAAGLPTTAGGTNKLGSKP